MRKKKKRKRKRNRKRNIKRKLKIGRKWEKEEKTKDKERNTNTNKKKTIKSVMLGCERNQHVSGPLHLFKSLNMSFHFIWNYESEAWSLLNEFYLYLYYIWYRRKWFSENPIHPLRVIFGMKLPSKNISQDGDDRKIIRWEVPT